MGFEFGVNLFFAISAAVVGGFIARVLRMQPLIGYILAGVAFSAILPTESISELAEIGIVLLLFSIGIELSFKRLSKVLKVVTIGASIQIVATTAIAYLLLIILGIDSTTALVLSLGFSVSSTAVVVKILSDKGELDTIHGQVMVGWLLIQDLAVVPMMIILTALSNKSGNLILSLGKAIGSAILVIAAVVILGRLIVPKLMHKVARTGSRELLILAAVMLALGTGTLTSLLGLSAAIGAFLAGVVISDTQENHAIFSETRPLRDLFVALFFVTLGLLVKLSVIFSNLWLIIGLAASIFAIKFLLILFLALLLGKHGKTAIATSLGLTQIGEFSFIIFSFAGGLGLISGEFVSIGIATSLVSLLSTPLVFKLIMPFWRKSKSITAKSQRIHRLFVGWEKKGTINNIHKQHIIICGFGRVGSWVGKGLARAGIDFVVIDYDQNVVRAARKQGIEAIYGDPGELEVLALAGIKQASAVVVAIPDSISQEELITKVQTISNAKIYSRAHLDVDVRKLTTLKVDKVVQPEFEAAVAITKALYTRSGKDKETSGRLIKGLRQSHTISR